VAVGPLRRWSTGQNNQQAIAVFADGKQLATAGDDGVVRIWQTETGQLVRELTDASDGLLCLAAAPHGRWLAATGKDSRIYVWDVSQEAPAKVLEGHQGWVASLAFSEADHRLLSGGFDATIRLWDVEKERANLTLPDRIQWVRGVALGASHGGPLPLIVSAGNAGTAQIWAARKMENGNWGLPWPPPRLEQAWATGAIAAIGLSPNGRLLAAGGWNRPLRVWDLRDNGRLVSEFGTDATVVCDLKWYQDNQHLLTACADGTLRLWDRRTGDEQKRCLGHTGAVRGVSLSADGRVVATTGDDGTVCLWPAMQDEVDAQDGSEVETESDSGSEAEADSATDSRPDDNVALRDASAGISG
jgi:WD40 repeat protein